MNKKDWYDLAYAFRKAALWKKIDEEELFAVRLTANRESPDRIGYCVIMGRNGDHRALAVYVGEEGFSSYRRITTDEQRSFADMLTQDCVQCSLEKKEELSEEELSEIREYCRNTGALFRAPFPQFTRYAPYRMPYLIREKEDWQVIGTALETVLKMNEVMASSGKAALGLRPIEASRTGQRYGAEQLGLFLEQQTDQVMIPLYSVEQGVLRTERIPLPPYREIQYREPSRFNEIAIARMRKKPQRGSWSAEVIRLPAPADGDPPYVPAMLMVVDEAGLILGPVVADGAEYDPDEMVEKLLEAAEDAYPAVIRVRTEETRALLTEFCRRAKICLEVTDKAEELDEAIDAVIGHLAGGEDGGGEETNDLDMAVQLLADMSVEEIRSIPGEILHQLTEIAELLPAGLADKIRKAKRKN